MNSKDRTLVAAAGTVVLRGSPVSLNSDVGVDFTKHCARNVEGLLPESELRSQYQLSDEDFAGLATNEQLLLAVRSEVDRRIANGEAAREAAQRHCAKAPSILNDILQDKTISPRHRIEAAKELRQVATAAPESAATGEKFVIMIDLGADQRIIKEFELSAPVIDDGDGQ